MSIQINGQTDTISAVDNNFSLAGNVSIGGTLTYEDVTSVDAVGLSTFQAGIHIDDSITHLGDTDTKIRFPANDTVTVETAGSERVRITSAGQIGIGTDTSTPATDATLSVEGVTAITNLDQTVMVRDKNTDDAIGRGGNIGFGAYVNGNMRTLAAIGGAKELSGNNFSGNLVLYTRSTGESDLDERLRITSAGQLLINTTTSRIVEDSVGNGPQGKIQIEATNSDAIMSIISAGTVDANRCGTINLGRHRNSTVGATPTVVQNGDALGSIVFSGGDGTDMRTRGATIIASVDGSPGSNDVPGRLQFSTRADGGSMAERLRITSSGNIGAGGITNPSFTTGGGIHLGDDYGIGFGGGDNGRPDFQIATTNGVTLDFRCGNGADTADMSITTGGQLKLGANTLVTPDSNADNFVIDTGDVDSGLSILSATTGRIYFGDAADDEAGSIRYVHTDNSMRFETNSVEKIRINQYGGLKLFNSSSSISGTDEGALYYNTLEKRLKVYNGNTWTNTDVGSDQYWSNVVLLIAGASTIVDASGRHTLTLNGNAATSTTYTSPVGNSHTIRLCPVNAGDYLNVQNNLGDFRLDDSDWTFEYWVRIVDTASSYFHIFTADGQGHKGTFKGYTSSSTISSMYFYSSQGNGLSHTTNSSFSYNTWMHVAWEFDDSADDFRLYIDGVLKETNTSMTFEGGNPTYAYFGRNTDQTNEHIEFYIDNIRWTRGVCRYNGTNFTPPTSPYPTS